jgi:hypothetical protein
MSQRFRFSAVASILLLASATAVAAQQCPSVYHQITWLEQDGQSYTPDRGPSEDFASGQPIAVRSGELIRLRTLIRNPNRASGDFQPIVTYQSAGKQGHNVVRIESDSKKPEVQRLGMVELRILKKGSAALTYKIEGLDHPSQRAPQNALGKPACASGQIRIASSDSAPAPSNPPSSNEFGFARTDLLFKAILLRPLGKDEAPLYIEQLRSAYSRDLVDVARQIAESPESKIKVPERLAAELGRMDMTPETRTTRMLEVLVGQISTRDPLWEATFQLLLRNQVAHAVEQVLKDPRVMEKHESVLRAGQTPSYR